MTKSKWLLIFLIMQALLLGGCAVTVKDSELIPSDAVTFKSTGKTIYVSRVTIRPQPKPGFLMNEPARLDGETFRKAIVETLLRTNLFTEVKKNNNTDYTLTADIVGQRLLGGTSNIGLLFVRYSLIESKNKSEIWSGNLFSHFETSAAEVLFGDERIRRLLESLTRDNMSKLRSEMGNILASESI